MQILDFIVRVIFLPVILFYSLKFFKTEASQDIKEWIPIIFPETFKKTKKTVKNQSAATECLNSFQKTRYSSYNFILTQK